MTKFVIDSHFKTSSFFFFWLTKQNFCSTILNSLEDTQPNDEKKKEEKLKQFIRYNINYFS